MKKIFFRIIVAVAVAFILSKLKLLNIIEVSALEYVRSPAPYNLATFNLDAPNTPTNYSITNTSLLYTAYYGSTLNFNYNTFAYAYSYNAMPELNNKLWDVSFNLLTTFPTSELVPVRVFIRDEGNKVHYCDVSSSRSNQSYANQTNSDIFWGYTNNITNVSCKNVYVQNRKFQVFVEFSLYSPIFTSSTIYSSFQGITLLQFINNSQDNTLNDIKNNTKETNDLLKDDSSVSNDKITDITNIDTNTSNTPVSDFITLPITLLNKYNTSMNSSCNSINLGSLLGTDLIIPCINLEQRLGSDLWSTIDKLFSFFMVFNIAMFCISIFERLTSLHDDFYSAYDPQHAYNGKHGGGS